MWACGIEVPGPLIPQMLGTIWGRFSLANVIVDNDGAHGQPTAVGRAEGGAAGGAASRTPSIMMLTAKRQTLRPAVSLL